MSAVSRDVAAEVLADPAGPAGIDRVIRGLTDPQRVFAWIRRYCCVSDDPDAVSLRRAIRAADAVTIDGLARWANSSSPDRRFPWSLVGAMLCVARVGLVERMSEKPLRFRQMGDIFSRLLCALSQDPIAGSAREANIIAHMQRTTAGVLLDAGFVPEHDTLAGKAARFSLRVRRMASDGEYRCFDRNWVTAIGHIVLLAHALVGQKLGLVDGRSIAVAKETVANGYLFNLVAAATGTVRFFEGDDVFRETHGSGAVELVEGGFLDWFEVCEAVSRAADPVRGAVLQVPEHDRRELAAFLEALGNRPGRGLVTVHYRESGYRPSRRHQPRNADIRVALPALQRLAETGYTVVRLGDPSMTRLPDIPGIVDYAHSPAKSDRLDVLLAAGADFHIGSSSGMSLVPLLFGTPCLFLDWYPTTLLPWGPRTWTVLKTLREAATGERVTDPELIHSVGKVPDTGTLAELGYGLDDLTAAETDAALDAYMAFLDGRPRPGDCAGAHPSATAPVFRFGPGGTLVEVPPRRRSGAKGAAGLP
ncbi:hypothetical protein GCM10017083_05580 [Thalassobaculum fulvum]|uniref:Uncharacterized protein n=1 Tax=Thalassobaculum fulvum TaxID=1633335 RepID=A0A919CP69_9PROT|nr:TIGR04372 family glycosyltransferase [Thalassobaculum fulvum]GHD41316.1 hypothetical protein GCM10017083_05580 [Thalassobaculum fulvum]